MNKLDPRKARYLNIMGIQVWERRAARELAAPDDPEHCVAASDMRKKDIPDSLEPTGSIPQSLISDATSMTLDWPELEQAVRQCTRCPLHKTRSQTVFGVGNRRADWMVIGEAPGAEEDRRGEPFVGRAGQLLNAMLKAIGLAREEVYIANILKSRPPDNRDPLPDEVAACEPFLRRQIELVQPSIILALGRIAAQNLLQTDTKLGLLRGKRFLYPGTEIPLVVTYHPAYLLRAPQEKRKAWEDLQFACKVQSGAA